MFVPLTTLRKGLEFRNKKVVRLSEGTPMAAEAVVNVFHHKRP
jgi:hypothetical protein